MPIRPENKGSYPADWPAISKSIRQRAGNVCEWPGCGAVNGQPNPLTGSKVVLTVAHLDHDPSGRDPARLMAMCQLHHLRYDAAHHAATAARTRRAALATLELFDE